MYFNNAATTWPKPEIVYETVDDCFRSLNSPDRTHAAEGESSSPLMQTCRRELAEFFSIPDFNRLIFAPSATYALNLAIHGFPWKEGDVILMSGLEHHAVSRPIRKVCADHGIEFHTIPYQPGNPADLDFVEEQLKTGKVRMIACTMASNVTGEILPSIEIGQLTKQYGATYLVDAAQSAGIIDVNVGKLNADMLAFAGHKGLFGPPGIGGLYVRDGIQLNTIAEGGTGKDSGKHEMSGNYPSNYEVGTHNLLSIVGMTAGVRWIMQSGPDSLREHEVNLTRRFTEGLKDIAKVTFYGTDNADEKTAVVSLNFDGLSPQKIANWLAKEKRVTTRAGYHCAPLAHETIGTLPGEGTIRFSFGFSNTEDEVDQLLSYMAEIPSKVGSA